jgi:hypothetical protein
MDIIRFIFESLLLSHGVNALSNYLSNLFSKSTLFETKKKTRFEFMLDKAERKIDSHHSLNIYIYIYM